MGEDERRLAADVALILGLRLAVGDDRPLPYSARFAAWRMGWATNGKPSAMRANRALRRLCKAGVLREADPLRVQGQPRGTSTFEPPLGVREAAAAAAERARQPTPFPVEPVSVVEPTGEADDEPCVRHAVDVGVDGAPSMVGVPAPAPVKGLPASWDRADGEHEQDATAAVGGSGAVEALLYAFPGSEPVEGIKTRRCRAKETIANAHKVHRRLHPLAPHHEPQRRLLLPARD